jgi:hypothetical protein
MFYRLSPILLPLIITGCAYSSGSKVQVVDRNGIDISGMPMGHQSVILKDPKFPEKYCVAPSPDALMDSTSSVSLSALNPLSALTSPQAGAASSTGAASTQPGAGVAFGSTANDINLGGRSPQVLIVREILYRFCELTLNADLSKEAQIQLWQQLMPMLINASMSGAGLPPSQPPVPGPQPSSYLPPSKQLSGAYLAASRQPKVAKRSSNKNKSAVSTGPSLPKVRDVIRGNLVEKNEADQLASVAIEQLIRRSSGQDVLLSK